MRDCRELLNSLHIGEYGRHELLTVRSNLIFEETDGIHDLWPTTAALLVLDADSASQRAIRELALRFQYGAVSVQPLEQPGDAAQVLAQANSAVVDLVVLSRGHDLTVLEQFGLPTPGMWLLVHDLPSTPQVHSLRCGEDAIFDGFVSGFDDPLGSAIKTFQMVASLRAPGTLNCMDDEDFLSVFAANKPVRVFAVKPTYTSTGGGGACCADGHTLTNGTDAVVVFDSRTERIQSIRDILREVRASPYLREGDGSTIRYLATKMYFRSADGTS